MQTVSITTTTYMFDIVKYGGVKIGLSILVRYKGRSHIVNHAAVPSFA